MRQFVELSFNDPNYKLEVYCYKLKPGEVDHLIFELENQNFEITFIDSDSIRGKLEIAQYPEIVKVREYLSGEGFVWSKNAKRISPV